MTELNWAYVMLDFCWGNIKTRVLPKLVNYEKNKELLKNMPYKKFLDLAITYYVPSDDGRGYTVITNTYMEKLATHITVNALHRAAFDNMRQSKHCIKNISDVISILSKTETEPELDNLPIYVLSNQDSLFGASEILNFAILAEFAEQHETDVIILPSSIHEVLLVIGFDEIDYETLKNMVIEVNDTCVDPDEVLSDHVYKYDRENMAISIVA